MFKTRTRPVNFRLTAEEFTQLQSAAAVSGARSLSDFARTATLRHAAALPVEAGSAGGNGVITRLLFLERRIEGLEASLNRALASGTADSRK